MTSDQMNVKIPSFNEDHYENKENIISNNHSKTFEESPNYREQSKLNSANDYKFLIMNKITDREIYAAKVIEKAWCNYRDRQMFRLLKHAVCAAEHSLSHEILRKISPLEANLLRDPCVNLKLKFRFAGEEFPPVIVFKIYTQISDGSFSKYITGKKSIKPATSAARQACDQMGNRRFYEQIISDSLQMQNGRVSDESDVVTLKDYMQYSSLLDELPSYLGGKSNAWRRLSLEDLSRHTIFYDILHYASTNKMSSTLLNEMPILLQRPTTQTIQLKHIEILSKSTFPNGINPSIVHLKNASLKNTELQSTARRTKNAINKVAKMKKAYKQQQQQQFTRSETLTTDIEITPNDEDSDSDKIDDALNDEFENQVNDLYLWSQNLSLHDDQYLKSPRVSNP